ETCARVTSGKSVAAGQVIERTDSLGQADRSRHAGRWDRWRTTRCFRQRSLRPKRPVRSRRQYSQSVERLHQPALFDSRLDEGGKERVRLERARFQLRMELHADEPRMV